MIFHQTSCAKNLVNSHPMNQITPPARGRSAYPCYAPFLPIVITSVLAGTTIPKANRELMLWTFS